MSMYQSEDTQGDFEGIDANGEFISTSGLEMSSPDVEKVETEFHLANETIDTSPRSAQSGGSSSEIFASPVGKGQNVRPGTKCIARISSPKSTVSRTSALYSSIPLPVKSSGPIKIPMLLKNAKSSSRTSSIAPRSTTVANRHTLEIQFINKNKRFLQMKKELVERQRPILDLYQNLLQIKKRLEELGKNVKLEEVKLVPFEEESKKPPSTSALGGGEQISMEVVNGMKSSIEEIPKTLMDICKNLLSRRALIVELLESVTKSEVDVSQVSEKIDSLKCEGQQLQHSLDAVIEEHESKISQLVANWQKLLNDKQNYNTDSKIEELEGKLKEEERLREESVTVIHDLHRKMEERRLSYDRSIAELNGVLHTLREQIKKLETELDNERKTSVDFKTRNNTNAQNLKTLRVRIAELEGEKKDMECSNSELQKKIRLLQDQLKHKECQWNKEKDEMSKSLKHQENLLQKLTADKNQFETRLETIKSAKNATEEALQEKISSLTEQLSSTQDKLHQTLAERNEALEKCAGFESYVARMKTEFEESMSKVSYSIEWGKAVKEVRFSEAENYMQDVAKDVRISELEDRIRVLQKERKSHVENLKLSEKQMTPINVEQELKDQRKKVESYQMMLEDAENKLNQKSTEVEHLRAEIRQLKVRQERLEEENERCSIQEMQQMLEEGRRKLNELMSRSMKNDDKVQEYITTIEKQKIQMNEMENLLRYRENMANVLKATRNELLMEKESLSRYSREVRAALAEVTNQSALKDDLIKSLRDKIRARESQIRDLERKILVLEETVQITNGKRYKLQETVGNLEKELQRTQQKMNHEKDNYCNRWSFLDSVYEVVEDKPNKKVSHYCNSLMENHKESELDLGECQNCIGGDQHVKKFPSSRKKLHNKHKKQNTFPTHSGHSSDKLSNQNISVTDNNSSVHTHCHHKANSRSLISLSLQTVDFLKTKLNFLSSVNTSLYETPLESQQETLHQISSTQTAHFDHIPSRNLSKILQLTAHRYEYLQNQAQESYDDLTNLVKLAVTQRGSLKK